MKKVFLQFSPETEGGGLGDNATHLPEGGAGNAQTSGANEQADASRTEGAGPSATEQKGESEDTNADGAKEPGSKNSAKEDEQLTKNHEEEMKSKQSEKITAEAGELKKKPRSGHLLVLAQARTGIASALKSFLLDDEFEKKEHVQKAYDLLSEQESNFDTPLKDADIVGVSPVEKKSVKFEQNLTDKQKINTVISMLDSYIGDAERQEDESLSKQIDAFKSVREHLVKAAL